jgi:AraC-like DNA-binding protein
MSRPTLLWIACPCTESDPRLFEEAACRFDVAHATLASALQAVTDSAPQVVVFDCTYPDHARLRTIEEVKRRHSHVAVLILTVEHSESLAVWAFRAGAWNYHVKPLDRAEFGRDLEKLHRVLSAGDAARERPMELPEHALPPELPAHLRRTPSEVLEPALRHIEANFRKRLWETDLARLCGLSTSEFSREFHRAVGTTFVEHVTKLRIEEARRLLRQRGATVADVGYAVGFSDPSYFARAFRRHVGESPSAFARRAACTELPSGECEPTDRRSDRA